MSWRFKSGCEAENTAIRPRETSMAVSSSCSRSRRCSGCSLTIEIDLASVVEVVVEDVDRHRLRGVLAEATVFEQGRGGEGGGVVRSEVDEPGVARQVDAGTAELRGAGLGQLTEMGIPWAIATSGGRQSADPVLRVLGVPPGTPIVTRDEVPFAKPDPHLFLAAAAKLGVDAQDAIVVGDSVWDMLAAQRARALGVGLLSGGYGREELERAGAFRVYEDPANLLIHLDELGIRVARR